MASSGCAEGAGSECDASLDNATAAVHAAARAQLCALRPAQLQRSWSLGSFIEAVLVIGLRE
eukprot:scaffold207781_cov31-Tisochrysis_lutea.AAC.1